MSTSSEFYIEVVETHEDGFQSMYDAAAGVGGHASGVGGGVA